jgi:hypothetical protein
MKTIPEPFHLPPPSNCFPSEPFPSNRQRDLTGTIGKAATVAVVSFYEIAWDNLERPRIEQSMSFDSIDISLIYNLSLTYCAVLPAGNATDRTCTRSFLEFRFIIRQRTPIPVHKRRRPRRRSLSLQLMPLPARSHLDSGAGWGAYSIHRLQTLPRNRFSPTVKLTNVRAKASKRFRRYVFGNGGEHIRGVRRKSFFVGETKHYA